MTSREATEESGRERDDRSRPMDENDGCQHRDTWFDRTLCFCEPTGIMHTVCEDCGAALDGGCAQDFPPE